MQAIKRTILSLALSFPLPLLVQADTTSDVSASVEKAEKEMMKITEKGFEPPQLMFNHLDSSAFFVNSTNDSLLSLEVDFGDRRAHCASDNMVFESGVMRSKVPLAPKDFALLCFPDKGTYNVIARGVATKPSLVGKVVVQ